MGISFLVFNFKYRSLEVSDHSSALNAPAGIQSLVQLTFLQHWLSAPAPNPQEKVGYAV